MFVKPRPYQQDIINKTLETTKSTLIQLPTGGGKTIISKEIAIGLINKFNKKILFITPKIVLMEQTLETFKDLKPQKVHGSNNKFDKNHPILISTLHTASRRKNLNPDVIIIDEVHFGYEKDMLSKIMEYNPNARIIGLSATPYYENGYPLKGFDVIINDYDLEYMIKNKYLVPLRSYILVKPDLTNVDIIAGDYEINQLSKAVSKNTIIMEIVATSKPYIEKSIKTIVFAVNINHAEILKKAFQNEGFITESIHSESEENDNEVIERFKRGYIKVLVSVYKLTTGFDVPETDLAIIARPTKSQNLYKQMVGRVLRIAPNKKNAILLDCGNVIENLGKPLDPIIPKDELEKKIQKLKCKHCESENIKLKKSNSNMYWECQDCGHKKDLENKNHYKCGNCNKKYSYQDGDFELVNNKLYLNCECGFETEISIATGDEEFREVDSGIDFEINKNKTSKYLQFEEARNYARNLNLKSREEWRNLVIQNKIPINIPKSPMYYLKTGWIDWDDWLFHKKEIEYLNFNEARDYVRNLNIKSKNEWKKFIHNDLDVCKPANIPFNPELYYLDKGWIDWNNWLRHETNFLSFEKARDYARSLNFKTEKHWKLFIENKLVTRKPENIPSNPELCYFNKGWKNWNDWLEIEDKQKKIKCDDRLENINYLSYSDAKKYVQQLEIKTIKEWKEFTNSENFPYESMPKNPEIYYKNKGWYNFGKFLGITKKEMNKQFRQEISKNKNNNDSNKFGIGKNVMHKIFGKGKIIDSVKNGKEQLLTVDFLGETKKIVSTFLTIIK